MSLLDRLEKRFGRFAVPNVTVALILAQATAFAVSVARPDALEALYLVPQQVLAGEVWRLVSFVFLPPSTSLIWAFLAWYFFYLLGTALEANWGTFKYNLFLLVGYLATVAAALAAAFLTPAAPASNGFLMGSVFLAFAILFPDFVVMLFFILPVKIKWLALLAWIGYVLTIAFGDWNQRAQATAAVSNVLLFFGKDILARMRHGHRRMAWQASRVAVREPPYYHRCTVCGITDRTHPDMDFRYCSQCDGHYGYCAEHLRNHEHVVGKK
jgi:hypothetical protein